MFMFSICIVFRAVIQFVQDSTEPSWRGYVYGCTMFISSVVQSFFLHQYFYKATLIGMRLRSTICAVVYNKVNLLYASVCFSVCIFAPAF